MKYGYARVSTLIQLKGNSLEEQVSELLKAGVPPENIIQEQGSGKNSKRHLFDELINIKLQPNDELVCCRLDRFARNAEDGLRIIRELMDQNIQVSILNIAGGKPFDRSPMGQLLFTLLLAFAEFERSLIIERTAAGKAIARTKAGYREGRPPIPKVKIEHAMTLLAGNSFKRVAEMTGISMATLKRYSKIYRKKNISD